MRPSFEDIGLARHKIASVSVHDGLLASLAEACGVDFLLVDDTLALTFQGHASRHAVTLDEMIYHTAAVVRATAAVPVVAALPFLTYEVSAEDALRAAGRLMKESGAGAVKLTGGGRVADHAARVVEAGIPVLGHLTYTPSAHAEGRLAALQDPAPAQALLADAEDLAAAGASAILLEQVPSELSRLIADGVKIPAIGIFSGPHLDGQMLSAYELLGLLDRKTPAFKPFANVRTSASRAIKNFCDHVREGAFPAEDTAPKLPEATLERLRLPT